MSAKMYRYGPADMALDEALAVFAKATGGVESIAILMSADACRVASVDGGGTVLGLGDEEPTAGVFEARAFNATAELRWMREAEGGRAAIIADQELNGGKGGVLAAEPVAREIVRSNPTRYLLWGRAAKDGTGEGWARLTSARIGTLTVPVDAAAGASVRLCALEYWAVADEHGNVAVIDERLTGLEAGDGG